MKLTLALTTLTVSFALAAPLGAQGIVLVQKETRGGQSATNRIQMDKEHIRAETRNGNDEAAFIFDGPNKVLRMVNITQKTYSEMSTTELQQLAGQMNAMMAQVQAQLQNLPPEQRALFEQMMQGRGGRGMPSGMRGMPGLGAPAKTEYRPTGTDKVGAWTCMKYEGAVEGQKTTELCTVDPGTLKLTESDFEAARQLSEFMKSVMPEIAQGLTLNGTAQDEGYAGVPVRRTTFRNGTVESVSEITEIRREAIPASTFSAPAGFRKEAMPAMPAAGAGR